MVDKSAFMQDHLVDKLLFLQGCKMNSLHPIEFFPELSDDRLRVIAIKLLDIRYETFGEMKSPFDDNYTRETAVFGRSRNMLVEMSLRGQFEWLSLSHAGMDITFKIGRVPCRFFRDDPDSPEKAGFFRRNAVDNLFAIDDEHPVMWRFVVEKALTDEDEDRVFFVGYNVYQEKISQWMYQASAPLLHTVDNDVPAAAEMQPASVDVRENRPIEQDGDFKTGSNE
jgi:hypothetical protein